MFQIFIAAVRLIYSIFIRLYPLAIWLASPFNQKAKLWIAGRKNIFEELKKKIGSHPQSLIWMHCASLGEFEQGRPVIEQLKMQDVNLKILVTFFSPSGYELSKNYKLADYVFYLPMDSATNASKFFEIVKPQLIIFVKYEFWYHYLQQAKKRNIALLLVSAIFRKDQTFFKRYGKFYRKILTFFTHIFVQNEHSITILNSINITNVSFAGDTRFDRVAEIAKTNQTFDILDRFLGNSKVVVAGSTWLEDDKELAHYANTQTQVKFIIAPHNIGKDRINECLDLYKNAVLFSELNDKTAPSVNTILIDNIGMLSHLYRYATVAYVGGGFGGDGVHNVLEPAVFGKPVLIGPEFEKYIEAVALVESGGAIVVQTTLDVEKTLDTLLKMDDNYQAICLTSRKFVENRTGATERVVQYIYKNRLLTN